MAKLHHDDFYCFCNIHHIWLNILCFQDIFKACFSASTSRSPGTLYHTKNLYQHRNVSGDVKACFNHAVELVGVQTDAYIIGAAMHHMSTSTCDKKPANLPEAAAELAHYRSSVVDAVLDLAFTPPNVDQVMAAHWLVSASCVLITKKFYTCRHNTITTPN